MLPLEERRAARAKRKAEERALASPEALPEAVEKEAKSAAKASKGKPNDPHAGNGGGAPVQSPAWGSPAK